MSKPELLILVGGPLCVGLLLVLVAAIHRLQSADTERYTSSPLVGIEILLVVALLGLTFVVLPLVGLVSLFTQSWSRLGFSVVGAVISLVAIGLAIAIDSPTLLYMT